MNNYESTNNAQAKQDSFCKCKTRLSITSGFMEDIGYWDVCTSCGKRIKDGHHYFNHYDGKDHEEFWEPNGEIYIDEDLD